MEILKKIWTKINPSKFSLLLIISIIGVSILLYDAYESRQQIKSQGKIIYALTDTLSVYKNKDGKNVASIASLTADRDQIVLVLKKKDTELAKLVDENKNLRALVKINTVTVIDTVVRVDTIKVTDTQGNPIEPQSLYIRKKIENPYYTADITIRDKELDHKLKVYNNFTVALTEKSNGFLKPKTQVVQVVNDNPYTETIGLSSYEFTPKPKNKALKIGGITIGVAAAILLLK